MFRTSILLLLGIFGITGLTGCFPSGSSENADALKKSPPKLRLQPKYTYPLIVPKRKKPVVAKAKPRAQAPRNKAKLVVKKPVLPAPPRQTTGFIPWDKLPPHVRRAVMQGNLPVVRTRPAPPVAKSAKFGRVVGRKPKKPKAADGEKICRIKLYITGMT